MKRTFATLCAAVFAAAAVSGSVLVGTAQNPIAQNVYTSDPAPMVYGDTFYMYTGHDADGADRRRMLPTCKAKRARWRYPSMSQMQARNLRSGALASCRKSGLFYEQKQSVRSVQTALLFHWCCLTGQRRHSVPSCQAYWSAVLRHFGENLKI